MENQWLEELENFFKAVEEMKSKGMTKDDIKKAVKELEYQKFINETRFLLDGGLSKPEVKAFWRDIGSFGDDDPLDAIDEVDKK